DPLRDPVMRPTATKLLEVFLSVLRAYRLDESAAVHAARCLRAIVHGFTSIEAAGGVGLPEDLDETFEQPIAVYVASLPRRAGGEVPELSAGALDRAAARAWRR